jgi:hypothetical protein
MGSKICLSFYVLAQTCVLSLSIMFILNPWWAHFIVIAFFIFVIKSCWIFILQYSCSYSFFSYFVIYIWDWACLCYCIGLGNIIDLVVFVPVTIWTNFHVFVLILLSFCVKITSTSMEEILVVLRNLNKKIKHFMNLLFICKPTKLQQL